MEFGAPHILQSDNGREFTASIIEEIVSYWPDCNIVHGRPRHPESQGSVERSNQYVENMLRSWMSDNSSTNWSLGCYFVQWQKNSSKHRIIGRTPYRALFGNDPKLGLKSTKLPDSVIKELRTEEELENIMTNNTEQEIQQCNTEEELEDITNSLHKNNTEQDVQLTITEKNTNENLGDILYCCVCSEKITEQSKYFCEICNAIVHLNCTLLSSGPSSKLEVRACSFCTTDNKIENERQESYSGQKRAAEKMTETSNKKFKSIDIVSYVYLTVPKVDRGPLDSKNLIGKVIDMKNGLYRLGTSKGIFKTWFSRNDIQESLVDFKDEVPDKIITVREAIAYFSRFGGQGFQKCFCKGSTKQCSTNKCTYFKNKNLCSSKCHGSSTCSNKN